MLRPVIRTMSISLALFVGLWAISATKSYAQIPDVNGDVLQRLLQARSGANLLGANSLGLGESNSLDQTTSSVQVYQPVVPAPFQTAPASRLEMLYSSRAGRRLSQFGYDVLGVPTAVTAAQTGGVQDNYVLNAGDEIIVDLRGQENNTYRQRIDRNGQLILPKLGPILAAGRQFGEVRADLERQVSQSYISTNVFVSVGQIRQISVLVAGEVRAPGVRVLAGLSTPLDAILLSGGIAKTGSLRNVSLIRGNRTIAIDLYALVLQGTLPDIGGLRNGDRIYVPPLHNTVAVTGYVRRPGIYELRDGQTGLDANMLLQLAGGIEIGGSYRLSKLGLESDGSTRLASVSQANSINDGEVLFVDSAAGVALGRVTLSGSVRLPGPYPRSNTPSVRKLISASELLQPSAYASFALIARRDPKLNLRTLIPFSFLPIFSGSNDIPLQDDDLIYVFKRSEIRMLADAAVNQQTPDANALSSNSAISNAATGGVPASSEGNVGPTGQKPVGAPTRSSLSVAPESAGIPVTTFLANNGITPDVIARNPNISAALSALGPDARIVSGGSPVAEQPTSTAALTGPDSEQQQDGMQSATPQARQYGLEPQSLDAIANTLGVTADSLVRLARDHIVWVLDEVQDPGAYLTAEGATLGEMIQMAGGVLRQADLSSVEVTSTEIDPQSGTSRTIRTAYKGDVRDFQRVLLRPLDVIRLRPVFSDRESGQIAVSGQVRYPGTFDITRGERLSSILERAGGVTDTAYPYGAVFTRRQAAAAERDGNAREARSINAEIASLATSPNADDRGKVSFLTTLTQQVQSEPALGRITVTADLAILRVRPELDIILQPGDALFVPPRPSTVTVTGEVLNSGSFQYQPGLAVEDYIKVAGGVTQGSDESRTFVVLPDGTARPISQSWLTFSSTNVIPPGSTVVVPRDLRPFDLTQFLRDATQITSQLAITAASLAVVGR
jgi:protein involved in polysaccharide export with SLBB domain